MRLLPAISTKSRSRVRSAAADRGSPADAGGRRCASMRNAASVPHERTGEHAPSRRGRAHAAPETPPPRDARLRLRPDRAPRHPRRRAASRPPRFRSRSPAPSRSTPATCSPRPLRSLPRPSRLAAPLEVTPGARRRRPPRRSACDTVGDLLEHLPYRHDDRREAHGAWPTSSPASDATSWSSVRRIAQRPTRRRGFSLVEATVADDSGPMKAVWFNQPWVAERLPPGTRVVLHGAYEGRHRIRVSEYELAGRRGRSPAGARPPRRRPLGRARPRLPGHRGHRLARSCGSWSGSTATRSRDVVEPLPGARCASPSGCPTGRPRWRAVHFPRARRTTRGGRRRLAFDELLLLQLALLRRRARRAEAAAAPALAGPARAEPPAGWPSAAVRADRRPAAGDRARSTQDLARDRGRCSAC